MIFAAKTSCCRSRESFYTARDSSHVKMISVAELKTKRESGMPLQLVDVRTPSEFATGHIPGATNIPMDQIGSQLGDLDHRMPLILVCQAGTRADVVRQQLKTSWPDAEVLGGGTQAWIKGGLPTVSCSKTGWSLERQVRLIAGTCVLTGAILAATVSIKWILLSGFFGAGLTFAGITDICPMGLLLKIAPWNKAPLCPTLKEQTQ